MPVRGKQGKLFLDFTWQHVRCKEYTGLADTPENRRRCEKKMAAVDRDIAQGTFDYRRHFPDGNRLHVFHPEARPTGSMTFQAYILRWYQMRSPFRSDGTLARDAALHPSTWLHDEHTIRKHFLPAFGPAPRRDRRHADQRVSAIPGRPRLGGQDRDDDHRVAAQGLG